MSDLPDMSYMANSAKEMGNTIIHGIEQTTQGLERGLSNLHGENASSELAQSYGETVDQGNWQSLDQFGGVGQQDEFAQSANGLSDNPNDGGQRLWEDPEPGPDIDTGLPDETGNADQPVNEEDITNQPTVPLEGGEPNYDTQPIPTEPLPDSAEQSDEETLQDQDSALKEREWEHRTGGVAGVSRIPTQPLDSAN